MESVIASLYAERQGVRVRRRNAIIQHPKHRFMLANVDRVIEGARVGLECKNVDLLAHQFGEWGDTGTDQIPTEYLLQCAHYMVVLDYPEWHLAACIGGNQLATYVLYEIGLKPMQALQNIAVVGNRPSLWGDAMLALVLASPVCKDVVEYYEGEGDTLSAVCIATDRRTGTSAPEGQGKRHASEVVITASIAKPAKGWHHRFAGYRGFNQ